MVQQLTMFEPEAVRPGPEPDFFLRDYQRLFCSNVWYSWHGEGSRSTLGVLPTGTGKTRCAAGIAYRVLREGGDFLWVVHREELLDQAVSTFRKLLPWAGVGVERGEEYSEVGPGAPRIVVASKDTLFKRPRLTRLGKNRFSHGGIDEAHHYRRDVRSYHDIVEYFQALWLGVTATARRGDGYGLCYSFESLAYYYHLLDAIRDGWLCPVHWEYVFVDGLDLSKVRKARGDLDARELQEVVTREGPLYGLCTAAVKYGNEGRRRGVIVFTSGVEHAHRAAEIINRLHAAEGTGVAVAVDSKVTNRRDRRDIAARFRRGPEDLQHLCNYNIYGEGADFPKAEVAVLGRYTLIDAVVEQLVGRVLRPAEEIVDALNAAGSAEERRAIIAASAKPRAVVVDMVGVSGRHRLAGAHSLMVGKCAPETARRAVSLMLEKKGGDLEQAVIDAIREEERLNAHKRRRVVVKANLRSVVIDPFDPRHRRPSVRKPRPAPKPPTEKMLSWLRKCGVGEEKLRSLTHGQAKRIGKLINDRRRRGLCTFKQASVLRKHGYEDPDSMTFDEARAALDALAANNWRRPA